MEEHNWQRQRGQEGQYWNMIHLCDDVTVKCILLLHYEICCNINAFFKGEVMIIIIRFVKTDNEN